MITLDDVIAAAQEVRQAEAADPAVTIRLYTEEGLSAGEIARRLGLHRSTIYRRLEKAGVYRGAGKSGAPRKPFCKRNHDMAVHAKQHRNGYRFCGECKRIRERKGGDDDGTGQARAGRDPA